MKLTLPFNIKKQLVVDWEVGWTETTMSAILHSSLLFTHISANSTFRVKSLFRFRENQMCVKSFRFASCPRAHVST